MLTNATLSTLEENLRAAMHALEDRDLFGDDSRVARAVNVMQDAINVVAKAKRASADFAPMGTPLVDRLRDVGCDHEPFTPNHAKCTCRLANEAADEIEKLLDALQTAEKADQKAINCEEHEPDAAPESCGECFPFADDARLKRWAALGINQPAKTV